MIKRQPKPAERNFELEYSLGLLPAPSDPASVLAFTALDNKVIIIADKAVAMQLLSGCRDMGSLPQ